MEYCSMLIERGLGLERLASEIGALGRKDLIVEETRLIKRLLELCRAGEDYKARQTVECAIKMGMVVREERDGKNYIRFVLSE